MIDKILFAREKRKIKINELLKKYKNIVTIKANIPGVNKNVFPSKYLTGYFYKLIKEKYCVLFEDVDINEDGITYYLSLDDINKEDLIELENMKLGRFIDLDLHKKEHSVSRIDLNHKMRKCLLCDDIAFNCIRNNKHSKNEIYEKILASTLAVMIDDAMMRELNMENKFGLVTKTSSGSHKDMDYDLMIKAKNAIIPYLIKLFFLGYNECSIDKIKTIAVSIGKEADDAMFKATKGINCYLGLIYLFGYSLIALGYVLKNGLEFDDIFDVVKKLTFYRLDEVKTREFKGARLEAANGLENVKKGLKVLNDEKDDLMTLIRLIQETDDTVLIRRSKTIENYQKYKKLVNTIKTKDLKLIRAINEEFVNNNLSCGGSADLLILTFFFNDVRENL